MANYMYGAAAGNGAAGWVVYQFLYNGVAPPVNFTAKNVIINCWDNALYVQLSYDGGVTYGDTIDIDPDDPPFPFPIAATHVRYQNKVAAQISRFLIVGVG